MEINVKMCSVQYTLIITAVFTIEMNVKTCSVEYILIITAVFKGMLKLLFSTVCFKSLSYL